MRESIEKKINEFYNDKNVIGFIAKAENKIVGFAYGYDIIHPNGKHAYFIYSIGMLPDYQDKGYGTKLLGFIKDYISSNGFFEMFVLTDKGNYSRVYYQTEKEIAQMIQKRKLFLLNQNLLKLNRNQLLTNLLLLMQKSQR